ncbi:MAG: glycosyltransferase family 4 protein [Bacteroidota bacterium]
MSLLEGGERGGVRVAAEPALPAVGKRLLLLLDSASGDSFWLTRALRERGVLKGYRDIPAYDMRHRTTRFGKLVLWRQYLQLAWAGLRSSARGDVIVSWNAVAGCLCAFLNDLLRRGRRVLILNLIVYEKGLLHTMLRRFVYRRALASRDVAVTVNSPHLKKHYEEIYGLSIRRSHVLHDVIDTGGRVWGFHPGQGYVFCGGEARRDWGLMADVAARLGNTAFVFAARRKGFPAMALPPNVRMVFDVPLGEFYGLLLDSSIVALPLTSHVTAGLIVLLQAARCCKPVIMTRSPVTENYITDGKEGVLVELHDRDGMARAVGELMADAKIRRAYAESLQRKVMADFTPEAYTERLLSILAAWDSPSEHSGRETAGFAGMRVGPAGRRPSSAA